jgi:hypothetical protein
MSNSTRNQPAKHRNRLMNSKQMANQLLVR